MGPTKGKVSSLIQSTQLELFNQETLIQEYGIDSSLWHGSFNGRESSLHQLSPYVGKLKSGMVTLHVGVGGE